MKRRDFAPIVDSLNEYQKRTDELILAAKYFASNQIGQCPCTLDEPCRQCVEAQKLGKQIDDFDEKA